MTTILNSGELPILLIVIGAVVLIPLIAVIVMYNRLVNLRNLVNESFADIDTELQRRHDLIPNLVNIVKGYAKHEKELFERITAQRAQALNAFDRPHRSGDEGIQGQKQIIREERELGSLLGDVIAVAENYPELKADENFRQLMREVRNTEDRIQAARRFFNANVRELNNRCEQFPSNMIAGTFKFSKADYFELDNPLARAGVNVQALLKE